MRQMTQLAARLACLGTLAFGLAACGHVAPHAGAPAQAAAPMAAPVAIHEASLQVGATLVPYRDSGGSGVPVVFLHAASGKSQMWVHQIPAFTAAGYRFIAIDWRQPNPGHRAGTASTILIEAVLNKLGVDKVHLVGTAAGGGAAFQYALEHPAKVRSLVVANSIGFVTDPDYLKLGERIRPAPHFNAMPVEFRELGPAYRAANPEGAARWNALAYQFVPAAPTLAPQPAPAAAGTAGAAPRPALGNGSNIPVTWARLETLRMPALLITGDADLYTPAPVLRMFGQRIRHAELEVFPETGHSAYWEQPEMFNRRVLTFLGKH